VLVLTGRALFFSVLTVVCQDIRETCVGDQCPAPGRSVLQVTNTKDSFDVKKLQEDDVEGESPVERKPELTFRQEGGMVIEKHGKFEIHSYAAVSTSTDEDKKWIISFTGGDTSSDLTQVENAMLPEMTEDFKSDSKDGGISVLMVNGTRDSLKKGLDRLQSYMDITIEEDGEMHMLPVMNPPGETDAGSLADTTSPKSWGLDRIDDRSGLDNSYSSPTGVTGDGVHVLVYDTGILAAHADFEGRAIHTLDVTSGKPVECNGSVTCADDTQGHGTHCAGTIGGKAYGVAKNSKLHAVKVLGDDGRGSWSWMIEALNWAKTAATLRPAIISASLGGRGRLLGLKYAVNAVTSAGVAVVVAAGNENDDACGYSPAYVPSAITVGATTKSDARAAFSNYGSCLDIFAPGKDIVSASIESNTGSVSYSGTSMACPHVSGAAALVFSEDPTRTVTEVEHLLKQRTTTGVVKDAKKGSPNRLLYTGLDTGGPTPVPTTEPPTPVPTPQPTAPKLPTPATNCSFESNESNSNEYYCGLWHNVADLDEFDWTPGTSATPTFGTGPVFAADGSTYMYIEASTKEKDDSAILQAIPLIFASDMVMKFKYHMRGSICMGSLAVTVNGARVWSRSGDQGWNWRDGIVDISQYKGTQPTIAFKATVGKCHRSDIAIDSVRFAPPPAPTPQPTPSPPGHWNPWIPWTARVPPGPGFAPPGPLGPVEAPGPQGPSGIAGPHGLPGS